MHECSLLVMDNTSSAPLVGIASMKILILEKIYFYTLGTLHFSITKFFKANVLVDVALNLILPSLSICSACLACIEVTPALRISLPSTNFLINFVNSILSMHLNDNLPYYFPRFLRQSFSYATTKSTKKIAAFNKFRINSVHLTSVRCCECTIFLRSITRSYMVQPKHIGNRCFSMLRGMVI